MEQMYFYSPFYEERGNTLFTPRETLEYGNVFKNEYKGYKNYKVVKLKGKTEKEEHYLNLLSLQNFVHDLKLKLDITPNDLELRNKYLEHLKIYQDLEKSFDNYRCLNCPEAENKYKNVELPHQWYL